jgi:hypothetical protein
MMATIREVERHQSARVAVNRAVSPPELIALSEEVEALRHAYLMTHHEDARKRARRAAYQRAERRLLRLTAQA